MAGLGGEDVYHYTADWLRDAQCRALFERALALAGESLAPRAADLRAAFPDDAFRPYLSRVVDLSPDQPPRRLLLAARQALELRELDHARDAWEREVASADARGDTAARNEGLRELAAVIQRRAEVGRSADTFDVGEVTR